VVFGGDPHDVGNLVAAGGSQEESRGPTEPPEVMASFGQDCLVGDDFRATANSLGEQLY
jgi:hypothetical protein